MFVVLVGWSLPPALASTPGSECDVCGLIFFVLGLLPFEVCDLISLLLLVLVAGFVDGFLSDALSALIK